MDTLKFACTLGQMDYLRDLAQALLTWRRALTSEPETLIRALQELDRLLAHHRRHIDPQLAHFLERRSYEKAIRLLGLDSEEPAGSARP